MPVALIIAVWVSWMSLVVFAKDPKYVDSHGVQCTQQEIDK